MSPLAAARPASVAGRGAQHDRAKLYFAYGSNLHLPQMAKRCPGSVFVGVAVLRGYRWQINERGVANVVAAHEHDRDPSRSGSGSGGSQVEGLLYWVTRQDEATLDRCEGVAWQLYQKQMLPVQFLLHPLYGEQPTATVSHELAIRLGSDRGGSSRRLSAMPDADTRAGHAAMSDEMALVYVSELYNEDGPIRDEYVGRMLDAVRYAMALGVSQTFVDQVMMPRLDGGSQCGNDRAVVGGSSAKHSKKKRDDDGGEASSGDAVTAGCDAADAADCTHSSGRLCRLRKENRQPQTVTGVRFHADLLALLAGRMSEDDDEDAIGNAVYVVVLKEPGMGAVAGYSVEAVTQNLALANELAMRHFRDACARGPDGLGKGAVIGPPVATRLQLAYEPGTCSCFLDNNRCLFFVWTLPDGSGQVRAWVTMQELLE